MAKKILDTELSAKYTVDGSEFNKGIDGINKDIAKSRKNLKIYEDSVLSAFDPSNVEGLEKGLKEVNKATVKTQDKLEHLNKVLADVDEGSDAWQKIQTEINKANKEITTLEKKQKTLNKTISAIKEDKLEDLPKNYQKAAKAAGYTTDKTELLNKEIKGLDKTNHLNDIRNDVISIGDAGSEAGSELTAGINGALENVASLDFSSSSGLLGSGASMIGGAGLAGLAGVAALVGTGLEVYNNSLERAKDISQTFSATQDGMRLSVQNSASGVQRAAKVYDQDFSEAVETAHVQMKIFNDTASKGRGGLRDYTKSLGLANLQYIDIEDSMSAANQMQNQWKISGNGVVTTLVEMNKEIDKYGKRADDLLDTYNEFGHLTTSPESFLSDTSVALELGMRNTDTYGNALNELFNTVMENTPEYAKLTDKTMTMDDAFKKVGLSIKDVQKDFKKGFKTGDFNVDTVFGQVIEGMAKIKNPFDRLAVSMQLFGGTITEQFSTILLNGEKLSAWADTYKNKMDELKTHEDTMSNIAKSLNIPKDGANNGLETAINNGTQSFIQYIGKSKEAGEALQSAGMQAGLSEGQISQLNNAWKTGADDAYAYLLQIDNGDQVISGFFSQLGIGKTEADGLTSALAYLSSGQTALATNSLIATGGLKTLTDIGVIGTQQAKDMQSAYSTLNDNGLVKLQSGFDRAVTSIISASDSMGLNERQTQRLKTNYDTLTSSSASQIAKSASLSDILFQLSDNFGVTRGQITKIVSSYNTLNDKTATAGDKQDALAEIVKDLGNSSMPSVKKAVNDISDAYDIMNGATPDDKTGTLSDKLKSVSDYSSSSYGNISNLTDSYSSGLGPLEKYQQRTGLLADDLERINAAGGTEKKHWWNNGVPITQDISNLFSGGSKTNSVQKSVKQPSVQKSSGGGLIINELNITSSATNLTQLAKDIDRRTGFLSRK